jgi:hypothetical protein
MRTLVVVAVLACARIASAQYNVPSQASGESRIVIATDGAEVVPPPEKLEIGYELGASFDFLTTGDPSLGGQKISFTDVVLFRGHGLVAIGRKVELFGGVDLLPKQPSYTDEHRWQGVLAGLRYAFTKSLSAYGRGQFGPDLAHDGFCLTGEAAGQFKHDLAERVLFWESSLGLTYTQLMFDRPETSPFFQTELLAQTGIAIRDSKEGIFATWLSFDFHFPLVHQPDEMVSPERPTDPQVRVGMYLGAVLGVTKGLDLFVEFSILDRGDVEDRTTTLPILSGGFDQRRVLFGFNKRFGKRRRQ